jgi:hypothetical protein
MVDGGFAPHVHCAASSFMPSLRRRSEAWPLRSQPRARNELSAERRRSVAWPFRHGHRHPQSPAERRPGLDASQQAAWLAAFPDTDGWVMTSTYTSPKQIKGTPAGVADALFSFGVKLYDLLTGLLPHAPKRSTPAAILPPTRTGCCQAAAPQVMLSKTPLRPVAALSPGRFQV